LAVTSRFIQVGSEATFGDTPESWTRIRATGFSDSVNRNAVFEEGCDIASPSYAVAGVYKATGTIDALLRYSDMRAMINNVLGADDYLSDGANTRSMSVIIGDESAVLGTTTGASTQYKGVAFTSMEFTFAAKEFIKTKFTWVGASAYIDPDVGLATLDTTSKPALTYNAVVKSGGAAFKCKSVTLKVDRKIDEDFYYIGSPLLQGIYANGISEISGTITFGANEWGNLKSVIAGATDNSYIQAPDLGTVASASTDSLNELSSISLRIDTASASADVCKFYLAHLMLNEMTHSVQGRNMWEKTVNFKAYVSATTDFQITDTLV